jgi:peptide deformylase
MKGIKIFAGVILVFTFSACSNLRQTGKSDVYKSSLFDEEAALVLSGESHQPMRVFLTTNQSDSLLLRSQSSDVSPKPNDLALKLLVDRMYSTVRDSLSRGVGIAAPQVGILKNIIWVQRFDKENNPFEVYFNPKILQYSEKKQERREGCLSIPNRSDTLNVRAYAILVEYQTIDGRQKIEMIEDFTAIIFQHEIDHLNGVLYTDYVK